MTIPKKRRRNVYKHEIDLKPLKILNAPPEDFRKKLEGIPYRGYEVEQLRDGQKIVIAKPGGKSVYGQLKKEDFFVWVYNPSNGTLWQITHKQIFEDIESKGEQDVSLALKAIGYLKRVHQGEEPEEILSAVDEANIIGESIEMLLKSYKWIWGQEDVNYPEGQGRDLSMKLILDLEAEILKRMGRGE